MQPVEMKSFMRHLALESGKIIKNYFRTDLQIEGKADHSPVTIADKKAEELMRTMIRKEFPEHGIIGEEFGEENPAADYKWILDPIDGTKSFICGAVTFGTLIALTYKGVPVAGVINQPILNEYLFGDNSSCELNGSVVKMRERDSLDECVLLTTDHLNIEKYQDLNKFMELSRKVKLYRAWGDCYGYYLLATGFADIMIDPVMSIWDTMALVPIIRGAGGAITDYKGKDVLLGTSVIAAKENILRDVLKIL